MGEVLNELNSEERDFFIETTAAPVLVDVLHSMPADDVSAILASLPEAQQEKLLKLIKGKASENLEQLLQYEEKTAGYIMTPNFFAAPEETTAATAVELIRGMVDVEMVFYVYVVDEENRLKGVISQAACRNKIRHPTERSNDNTGIHGLYPHTAGGGRAGRCTIQSVGSACAR